MHVRVHVCAQYTTTSSFSTMVVSAKIVTALLKQGSSIELSLNYLE